MYRRWFVQLCGVVIVCLSSNVQGRFFHTCWVRNKASRYSNKVRTKVQLAEWSYWAHLAKTTRRQWPDARFLSSTDVSVLLLNHSTLNDRQLWLTDVKYLAVLLKTVQFHSTTTTKKPRPLKTVRLQNTPRYHFSHVRLERKKPRPRPMKKQFLKKGNVMETSARKEKGFNLLRIRLQFPSWNYKGRLFCKYLVTILLLRVKLGH